MCIERHRQPLARTERAGAVVEEAGKQGQHARPRRNAGDRFQLDGKVVRCPPYLQLTLAGVAAGRRDDNIACAAYQSGRMDVSNMVAGRLEPDRPTPVRYPPLVAA